MLRSGVELCRYLLATSHVRHMYQCVCNCAMCLHDNTQHVNWSNHEFLYMGQSMTTMTSVTQAIRRYNRRDFPSGRDRRSAWKKAYIMHIYIYIYMYTIHVYEYYYTILYYTILYYTILYYTILYYTILYYTIQSNY